MGKWLAGIAAALISGAALWALNTYGTHFFMGGSSSSGPADNGKSAGAPSAPAEADDEVAVDCSANPGTIAPGGSTEISVKVTKGGKPVGNAPVTLSAGGGSFGFGGGTTVTANTYSNGTIRTLWKAPSPAAVAYGLSASAKLPDGTTGEATCQVLTPPVG